ncbi:MAG: ABC transporter ATP-binding protein [Gammaproteobacteria bacterium]|nr:ABC transporter ATP-binding protein [Gammaproteobacteria bacterium]
MVKIQGLRKSFGPIVAVDDISFDVGRGEVLGFLGPNGAGKSTTMKMITGFLTPDAGQVHVAGEEITANPISVKRKIGYLPEGAPLYGDMTTHGLLSFIASIRGLAGAERQRRIDAVVERVNLKSVLEQPIETLSKGFKRRVGLAQSILHDPQVLVLDEPTDGLDPNQKHEVRLLIQEMSQDKVIILSTHILEEVDAVCSRAIIIAGGKLVSDGTPAELEARSPLHNSVVVSVGADQVESIAAAVGELASVESVTVESTDAGPQLRAIPVGDVAIAGDINKLARERDWRIDALHVERGRLDDVFRQITTDRVGLS